MGSEPTIALHGPSAATHVRRGRWPDRWVVAAVVEVWGAPAGAAGAIAQRVGTALVDAARPGRSRSLSASLRAGLEAADHEVRRLAAGDPLLGAGASILAWDGRALLLAQGGPSVAYAWRPAGGEGEREGGAGGRPETATEPGAAVDVARLPAESPWLRAEGASKAPDEDADAAWPALGWPPDRPGPPAMRWTSLAPSPGLRIVLATTPSAERLPRDVARALLATPASRGGNALAAALPASLPALWFGLPEAREADGVAHAAGADADAEAGAGAGPRAEPGRRRGIRAAGWFVGRLRARSVPLAARAAAEARPRLRALAAGALGLAEALLPSRPPEHPRDERALAAAATAVILPLAVAAVTTVLHLRLGPEDPTPPADVAAAGAVLDETVPGSPAVRRLAGIEIVAPLAGGQADARVLVVAPDARYVLNRAIGAVERIAPDTVAPRLALVMGQTIGGETVGALEDLAWIPHEDGGGRVLALDAAGRLWQVDGQPRPIGLSPPSAQASPARLAGDAGRLYLLDHAGAITRYRLPDADTATATEGGPWAQGLDLAGAVDLGVDGAVLVLFGDGRLLRLVDGQDAGLALDGLDPPLHEPTGLYAAESLGRVLVADAGNGRIVDLSAGGSARARLMAVPVAGAQPGTELAEGRIPDLQSVWWQRDEGLLWIVAGPALLRAPFDAGG